MKLIIKSPEQVRNEQLELIKRALVLMDRYDKYNQKARKKLQWTMYQINKLERLIT